MITGLRLRSKQSIDDKSMDQNTGALSPFVYWGQTSTSISLKIDLKNVKVCHHLITIEINLKLMIHFVVKSPLIDLKEKTLNFLGSGIGAKGLNEYAFLIEFYSSVEPNVSLLIKSFEFDLTF